MKKVWLLLVLSCVLLQLSAQQRLVKDMIGRKIMVPVKINKVYTDRFASLIVFALDAKMACNYTFQVREEGRPYISPDYYSGKVMSEDQDEEILKQKPELIIYSNMSGVNVREKADAMQKRLNIPVVVINFTLPEYKTMFLFLGKVLSRENQSKAIAAYLDKYINPVHAKAVSFPVTKRATVYYAEGMKGLNTEPSGSFHSQVIDFVCARNVAKTGFGNVHGMSAVSMEQVLNWDPAVIFVWTGMPGRMGVNGAGTAQSTYDHILADPTWAKIKAVQNRKVYQIPELPFGWFDRPPTTNIIPGVLWAARQLYPNDFKIDMTAALKEYFSLFYHVNISTNEINKLLN